MNAPNEAWPLSWPAGWPRTPAPRIQRARFNVRVQGATYRTKGEVTLYVGRSRLLDELKRLGATDVMISTNVATRQDGLPYSKAREPDDHGAAAYFRIKGKPRVLACDKWDRVADNMAALAAHVEAMRGQVRWGVGSLEQAFGGYLALTAVGAKQQWWEVLAVPSTATLADIERKRIELLQRHHPDKGGTQSRAAEINAAADEARRELSP